MGIHVFVGADEMKRDMHVLDYAHNAPPFEAEFKEPFFRDLQTVANRRDFVERMKQIKEHFAKDPNLYKRKVPLFKGKHSGLIAQFVKDMDVILKKDPEIAKIEAFFRLMKFHDDLQIKNSKRVLDMLMREVHEQSLFVAATPTVKSEARFFASPDSSARASGAVERKEEKGVDEENRLRIDALVEYIRAQASRSFFSADIINELIYFAGQGNVNVFERLFKDCKDQIHKIIPTEKTDKEAAIYAAKLILAAAVESGNVALIRFFQANGLSDPQGIAADLLTRKPGKSLPS